MATLEEAAKAWTALGQAFQSSWSEAEAALTGLSHSVITTVPPIRMQELTADERALVEED